MEDPRFSHPLCRFGKSLVYVQKSWLPFPEKLCNFTRPVFRIIVKKMDIVVGVRLMHEALKESGEIPLLIPGGDTHRNLFKAGPLIAHWVQTGQLATVPEHDQRGEQGRDGEECDETT